MAENMLLPHQGWEGSGVLTMAGKGQGYSPWLELVRGGTYRGWEGSGVHTMAGAHQGWVVSGVLTVAGRGQGYSPWLGGVGVLTTAWGFRG